MSSGTSHGGGTGWGDNFREHRLISWRDQKNTEFDGTKEQFKQWAAQMRTLANSRMNGIKCVLHKVARMESPVTEVEYLNLCAEFSVKKPDHKADTDALWQLLDSQVKRGTTASLLLEEQDGERRGWKHGELRGRTTLH